MPGSSLLYPQPPEASEVPKPPSKALSEGLQVSLTELWIFGILAGVGEGYKYDSTPISPEGATVDAGETPEEGSTVGLGESPDPPADASALNRTDSALNFTTLERDLG